MKLHMDLDCYFVSAERSRYPFLNNKAVVVAKGSDKQIFNKGRKEGVLFDYDMGAFNNSFQFVSKEYKSSLLNRWKEEFVDADGSIHGIVIAKSYEAKKYKIKTGTPLNEALMMCPHLIVLPSDHLFYQSLSFKLKSFLESKIPLLEQYSIDEFFGDINGWIEKDDTLEFIQRLQADVMREFALPISIAASKSKWIAKLATDTVKPYGCRVLYEDEVQDFTDPIAIEEFPGIGRAIEKRLKGYCIFTLGEAKRVPGHFLAYGKSGRDLYKRICGEDNEAVVPSRVRKGMGISRNFQAIQDRDELKRRVMVLARYLSFTLTKLNLQPTTFYMKLRYQYGYKSKKSVTIDRYFNEHFFIELMLNLFRELDIYKRFKIHFIAISTNNFITKSNPKTLDVIHYQKDRKNQRLTQGLAKIRQKYGVDMIRYGREAW
jgi:DNA polymerase-4